MSNNRKHPSANVHFERTPVNCPRCKRQYEHFVFEVIDDLVQLRCGNVIIPRADMVCLHCKWVFRWEIKENTLERMANSYEQLLGLVKSYAPE